MKKFISCLLVLQICILSIFSAIAVEAATKREYLSYDKIKFSSTQSKLISSTITGNYETNGFTSMINLKDNINKNQAFYIKIDESVFDLNPTKIVYCLKCDGNYNSKEAKFYFSKENNGACPLESDTVVGFGESNGIAVSISTTETEFEVDLTSDKYKNILTNKLNYFYLFNNNTTNNIKLLSLLYIKIYYNSTETEYSVNIDNDTYKKVSSGESVTLPNSTEKGFIAYTDGTNYYDEGEIIKVEGDVSLSTVSVGEVTMEAGAAIRLNEVSGIRFYTNVDTQKIASLRENGYTVTMGTLISPRTLLNEVDLTHKANAKKVDVIFNANSYYTENNFIGIVGSLVKIKQNNYNLRLVGRGYVTVSKGSYTKTVYANYTEDNIENNSRSIAFMANEFKLNPNYTNEYNGLSDEQKALVEKWAAAFNLR